MTVADNSLQELAASVPHEDTQEVEGDQSSDVVLTGDSITVSNGKQLHVHVSTASFTEVNLSLSFLSLNFAVNYENLTLRY